MELPCAFVKGITIKLPEATPRRLAGEARVTGRSIAALVRERVEAAARDEARSVYALASDPAGCVAGSRRPAANARRRFRRA